MTPQETANRLCEISGTNATARALAISTVTLRRIRSGKLQAVPTLAARMRQELAYLDRLQA